MKDTLLDKIPWKAIIEKCPAFIGLVDGEGKLLYINHVDGGMTLDDVVGTSIFDFVIPEDAVASRKAHADARASGEVIKYDTRAILSTGVHCTYRTYAVQLDPADPDVILHVAFDVSEDREIADRLSEVEVMLRKDEARYRALVDNSFGLVHLLNKKGEIIYASPPFKRFLGYESGELEGKSAFDMVHPDDIKGANEAFGRMLAGSGEAPILIQRIKHKDGHWVHMEVTAKPFFGVPDIDALVVYSHDVTERIMAEHDLRAKNEELQQVINSMVNRESRMVELKTRITELEKENERLRGKA